MINQYETGTLSQFQLGRVLQRAFSGVFSNLKPILMAIIIVTIIGFIAGLIPTLLMENFDGEFSPLLAILLAITTLFSFAALMFICVFTDITAFSFFSGRSFIFNDAMKRALKATFPILFIVILYFIAVNFASIFFLIPGIILSVGWTIIGPVYLHEDVSLFGSFSRAWELTNGYKWWVFLATLIMNILMLLILIIPFGIMGVGMRSQFTNPDFSTSLTPIIIIVNIITSILMYFILSIYASFTTALYAELKQMKDGFLSGQAGQIFD